jgi:ABC-2 type transport system permease protein
MSRFAEIARFEVAYLFRRPSTWIYLVFLAAISVLTLATTDPGSSNHFNAPVNVAGTTLLMGFVGVLITAALFGDAAGRDVQSRMHPLFYAAPLSKMEYLGGRFAGTLLVNALLLTIVPIALALVTQVPGADPGTFGPFRAESYVGPYFFFLLPNLLVNASILFGFTALSRRAFPSYLAAIALFAGYVVAVTVSMQADHAALAALIDPTGFVAVTDMVADWTPVEQNTRPIRPSGILLWNRALWMAVGLAALAFTFARFRFAHHVAGARRGEKGAAEAEAGPRREAPVAVPVVPRTFGSRAQVQQTLAVTGRSFREILVSRDFLFVVAGMLILVFTFGPEVMEDDRFGIPAWPMTQHVTGFLRGFFIAVIVSALTAFYAGELVWRERDAGVSSITDAAPVPDWVCFLSKFLALALMLAALQAVLIGAGMLLQTTKGFYRYEVGLYLRVMMGMQLLDYLLLAAVAMLVHVLVNQKYLGHLIVLVFYLCTVYSARLGIEHNLLVYGSDPGWMYSDMAGFGPFLKPFLWFKLYWAAWALLLATVASLFWVRGTDSGLGRRLRQARRRFTRPLAMGASVAAMLILTTGGFVFYNTNVLNEHRTDHEKAAIRAGYEKLYKRFENIPQPWVLGARLDVEIYPERREVQVRGTYRMVNNSAVPIDSVHISQVPDITVDAFGFDRRARRVLADDARGYWIYTLDQPLQPGDSLQLTFAVAYDPRGFPDRDIRTSVVGNGTMVPSRWLPSIGYNRDFEIPGTYLRADHGLARRPFRPSIDDQAARRVARSSSDAGWIELETVVGTSAGQIAVAPGTLRREWTENGRRYFHYRTDAPILNFYAFLSADYAVHEADWNGVQISVLHHPSHTMNVERIVGAVRASLDYYTRNFGPYPHRQIRLLEFPRYERFARAYPGQIVYSEGSGMMSRVDDAGGDFDSPFMTTAHEVAHQWWGHQVMGADVQGSQALSETLAQYSALMVMEKTHAAASIHEFLKTMQIEYLNRRGDHANPEVPLLLTGDHDYLHYRKGAVVMYALRDFIGEDRVNAALRQVVAKHGFSGPPFPTSLDLYRELQAVTPDSLKYLLEDLVATITLWDLRTSGARAEPAGGGSYRVTLNVDVRKVRSDSIGNDTEVPMNDLVEVGVFAAAGKGEALGRPLYLRKHRLRSGQHTITVTVPGRPARAGIDPYHKLITRHKEEMDEKLHDVEVGG